MHVPVCVCVCSPVHSVYSAACVTFFCYEVCILLREVCLCLNYSVQYPLQPTSLIKKVGKDEDSSVPNDSIDCFLKTALLGSEE